MYAIGQADSRVLGLGSPSRIWPQWERRAGPRNVVAVAVEHTNRRELCRSLRCRPLAP